MKDNGIQYFNRYTGKVETEVVYGERWLRFILFNPFGKIVLHTVAKRAWFSRWYGWRMSRPSSAARVCQGVSRCDDRRYPSRTRARAGRAC